VQPHPREIAPKAIPAFKIVRDEFPERAKELVMRDAFQVDLKHHVGKNADDERHEQSPYLVFDELARAERIEQARARNDKHDRHQPVRQKGNPHLHAQIGRRVLDVLVALVKEARAVENKDSQDRPHVQPIEIVATHSGFHDIPYL
jgi:hypothetical protein